MKLTRLLLVVVATVSAAAPILASDEQDCFQGQVPELRIKGCSGIIQQAPNDATAYHNRAVAYELAGNIDNAIADYTKVIELAPKKPKDHLMVVNLSGRGDKDIFAVAEHLGGKL